MATDGGQLNQTRPKYYRETTIDFAEKQETILMPDKVDFFVDHPEADFLANPDITDKLTFLKESREKKFPNRYKDMADKIVFLSHDPTQLVDTKPAPTLLNRQAENFASRYDRKSLTEAAMNAQLQMEPADKMTFFSSQMHPAESQYFGNPEDSVPKSVNRKSLTEAAIKAQLYQRPQDKMAFFDNAVYDSQSQEPANEISQLGNPRVNRKSLAEAELRAQLNPEQPDKITFFGNSTFETTHLEITQVNRKSLNEAQVKAQLNQQPQDKMTFFGNPSQDDGNRKSIPEGVPKARNNSNKEAVPKARNNSNNEAVPKARNNSNNEAVPKARNNSNNEAVPKARNNSNKEALPKARNNSDDKAVPQSQSQAPANETSQLGNPRVNRKSLAEAELRAQLNPEQPDKITFFGNSTFETTQLGNTQMNRKSLNEAQLKAQLNQQPQDKMAFFGSTAQTSPNEILPQNETAYRESPTEIALRAQLRKPVEGRADRKSLNEAQLKAQLNEKPNEKMHFFGNTPYKPPIQDDPKSQIPLRRYTEAELKAQVRAQAKASYVASSRMNILEPQPKLTKREAREARKRSPRNTVINIGKHGQKNIPSNYKIYDKSGDAVIQAYNVEVLENNQTGKKKVGKSKDVEDDLGFKNDYISASHTDFVKAHKKLDQKIPRRHGKEDPDGIITPSGVGSTGSNQLSSVSTFNLLRDGSSVPSADVSEFERFSGGLSRNSHTGIDLSTLRLNNLDDRVGYQELHNLFPTAISFAAICEKDQHGKRKKRYTFVIFDSVSEAAKALKRVNGNILHGLPLHLDYRRYAV